jgi:superfamily II DNA or RNA helicase
MNFIKTSCIRIPLIYEPEHWYQNIIKDLTRSGSSYEDPSVKVTSIFYEIRDGHLWIPRFYPVETFGHKTIDYCPDGDTLPNYIEFKTKWRNDLQFQSFKMMTSETRGVLKLKPGEGKTVITIGAICQLRRKSIIYVHKDSLLTQWKERFLEHCNIKEDDIGIMTTADRFDVLQKPIVLSTVQTMNSMIDRVSDIEKIMADARFGVAVWDECHTTSGAEKFSRSALFTPAKRVFGLSATPGRADHNHDIIWHHLGQVFEPDGISDTMKPRVVMLYFDHKAVALYKKYIYWGPPTKDGSYKLNYPKFDTPRYLAMLTGKRNDAYIPMMRKIVRKVYDSNRTTLFISDRIKVLDLCASVIPNKNDVGFFIPRSGDNRDTDLLKKFVFSTPGSSRDGTDRPEFDCLILANRIANIEQAVGRICRSKPNKQEPVVMDIVDSGCEDLMTSAAWRKKFYEEKGWKVDEKFLK